MTAATWREGIDEFNAHRYWDAHERWEQGWKSSAEPLRSHVQGLIQACGVFVHLEKGRGDSAKAMAKKALKRLNQSKADGLTGLRPVIDGVEALLVQVAAAEDPFARAEEFLKGARRLRARMTEG